VFESLDLVYVRTADADETVYELVRPDVDRHFAGRFDD
jgi:hypothetical protein